MRLSSQLRYHPQTNKSKLEVLITDERKSVPSANTPHISRSAQHKDEPPFPFHFSGPQLSKSKIVQMQNERTHNLSAYFPNQRVDLSEQQSQKKQEDVNASYMRQIDALTHKRKARYYFKKQRQGLDDNYKIGVMAGPGFQEYEEQPQKVSQSTQPAVSLLQKECMAKLEIQQMHYQMVKTQQKFKHILKQ